VILRDLLPEERDKLYKSGYRLYGEGPKPDNLIFTRAEILQLAREFGMGEGYHYIKAQNARGESFMQLRRIDGHPVTTQYLMDRIVLLQLLFRPSGLSLVGNK
jgi:hypothetical protein